MKHLSFPLLSAVVAVIVTCADARADFVYTSPAGVRWTVTENGLSAIHLGERQLAQGQWQMASARRWYPGPDDDPAAAAVEDKSIEVLDDQTARVRHVQGALIVEYSYRFDGEDLHLSAWVENHHDHIAVTPVLFTGLTFEFGKPPTGRMPLWHASTTRRNPTTAWHPNRIRIGASWAVDEGFGVGVSPGDAFTHQTLVTWEWNWQQHMRESDPQRMLRYFVNVPIEPAAARTFTLVLRVSDNTDWKNLVAPYRDTYQRANPTRYYDRPDHRPVISSHINSAVKYISEKNPYGLHTHARLDTKEGYEYYFSRLLQSLVSVNAQGVIIWGQTGSDPRGAMYRPDFDVVPPEVQTNVQRLARELDELGYKVGLTARPAEIAMRRDWDTDLTAWLTPTHNSLRILGNRFQRAHDWGTRLYYLDVFGNRMEDVAIMKHVRTIIGPTVMTYAEHTSDVILPYSGIYTSLYWNEERKQYTFSFQSLESFAFYRWLEPDLPIYASMHPERAFDPPAEGVDPPTTYLLKHKVSPLFHMRKAVNFPEQAAAFAQALRQYLDDEGQWIE